MMPTPIRKLLGLSLGEFGELISAQFALIRAQLSVWIIPTGRLVTPGKVLEDHEVSRPPEVPDAMLRLGLAVQRVAHYGLFRPKCLVQSIALKRLLEARGYRGGTVKVGVMLCQGEFRAHAWVEYQGVLLGDSSWTVAQYTELMPIELSRKPLN